MCGLAAHLASAFYVVASVDGAVAAFFDCGFVGHFLGFLVGFDGASMGRPQNIRLKTIFRMSLDFLALPLDSIGNAENEGRGCYISLPIACWTATRCD
jgi:hypothetical protein